MGDAEKGEDLWRSETKINYLNDNEEIIAHIPSTILERKYVSR